MKRKGNILLWLPSLLYGVGVSLRNLLFDLGVFKSYQSSIPVICIGNLSVGGTGKTPHIELLLRLLLSEYRVAVLSRGYGRRGSAPIVATSEDTASTIGDEPFQLKRKYPHLILYIDGNRKRALKTMEKWPSDKRPDVVLMDDGFQHRWVAPTYSILLTPYEQLYTQDHYLPYGDLREDRNSARRADSIIVTHTPQKVQPIEIRHILTELDPMACQEIFFSRIHYEEPRPLFCKRGVLLEIPPQKEVPLFILSGIANPTLFVECVKKSYTNIQGIITYEDHHAFTEEELQSLFDKMLLLPESCLLTTEKDAVRILGHKEMIPKELYSRIWYLPIEVYLSPKNTALLLEKARKAIKNNTLYI